MTQEIPRVITFGKGNPPPPYDKSPLRAEIKILEKNFECSDSHIPDYDSIAHRKFNKQTAETKCSEKNIAQSANLLKNGAGSPFKQELDFLFKNSEYRWGSLAKAKTFPQSKKDYCDICRGKNDAKPKKNGKKQIESGCGHKIHQICRSTFAKALWDINGKEEGYQIKDCPICYWEYGS